MRKKIVMKLFACVLAVAMPLTTALFVFAEQGQNAGTEAYSTDILYQSPDINKLTGMGEEPEELSVSAGAEYLEKAWYEYVNYSDQAVTSYRLTDDSRLLFYDPYTYTNAMVMEVNFDAAASEFDTMSSYTISKTNTKTITACVESTDTSTNATQTSGRDKTHTDVVSNGVTKTIYNHTEDVKTTGTVKEHTDYEYVLAAVQDESYTSSHSYTTLTSLESETGFTIGAAGLNSTFTETIHIGGGAETSDGTEKTTSINHEWLTNRSTDTTEYSPDYKTTTQYSGDSTVEDNTVATTDGWTELSARVTKTLGSSRSTSNSWSEEESVTVTKTYAATHFASDGVTPLPWAIAHYEVQMPMKCVLQVKNSGEWVSVSTIYTMLTTVKGTCRAWMQNGQVYYEDWGSGEPVVATDFWAQFLTKEQLMNAYQNKLYPVGGAD